MRRFPLLAALAVSLALSAPLRSAIPFPQAESDLHPDPAAAFGTLPNGVRYVVMPNHEPKGRVSLRLLVLAGSFDETEAQRGLAHFLEHMAFNGSTHYAPGTLVEKLQRLGMGFGADTNASTSWSCPTRRPQRSPRACRSSRITAAASFSSRRWSTRSAGSS